MKILLPICACLYVYAAVCACLYVFAACLCMFVCICRGLRMFVCVPAYHMIGRLRSLWVCEKVNQMSAYPFISAFSDLAKFNGATQVIGLALAVTAAS